jgi:hypothetical protein
MSVAAIGVGLVTVVGGAVAAKSAADRSARAQREALAGQKGVDVADVTRQAREADLQKYRDQFRLQAEVDPGSAALRESSNKALQESVFGDPNEKNANEILKSLFNENVNVDPNDANFVQALKTRAQETLALGGKISPDQQAELVRAGLETGAQSGFNAGSSATRQGVGKLLASESEALAASRAEQARGLFGFATDINSSRVGNLTNIGNASTNAAIARNAKLTSIANLADSRVPEIGIGGGDIANLAVGNTNQGNQVTLQRGAVAAQNAAANGQIISGLIGKLGGAAQTYLTTPRT